MNRILVIDDDIELCELLSDYLSGENFTVETVNNGKQGAEQALAAEYVLVILDVMLPGMNGFDVLRKIRESSKVPVIMLTARGDDIDRIVGLEMGADDYLPKPFNPRELLARIRSVLRRNTTDTQIENTSTEKVFCFGEFSLDVERKLLFHSKEEVALTTGEMTLLIVLAQHPDHVLSRDQLMDMITGHNHEPFDRSIDVRITRLRHKIESNPSSPQFIRTVWGQGYRFTPKGDQTETKSNS